jgi:hypothetical protein
VYFGRWFEVMHIDVWPLLMILFATLNFAVCARWLRPPTARSAVPIDAPANVAT